MEAVTPARAASVGAVAALLLFAAPARADVRAEVTVTSSLPAPILGVDHEAELRIDAAGDETPLESPRMVASTGRIEEITRVGPRAFTARYVFPVERYPQVAIVAAVFGDAARGHVFIPLRAPTSLAFHTDPGASVTIQVGPRSFGPERADRSGNVRVPVVVPPGISSAIARSVNTYGKSSEQMVDLAPPAFRRALILGPASLSAGALAEFVVLAVDPSGGPADPDSIALASAYLRPHPLGGAPGERRFLVRAPGAIDGGPLALSVSLQDREVHADAAIPLGPGPAVTLRLSPDRPRLPIGSGASMRVYVSAQDAFGNACPASGARVFVDGRPAPARVLPDGRVAAIVTAPPRWNGRVSLQVEALVDRAYARDEVALSNVPPPRRRAPAVPDPVRTVTPRLGLVWNLRQAPGAAVGVEALWRLPRLPRGLSLGGSLLYLRSRFPLDAAHAVARLTVEELPILALVRYRHRPWRAFELAAGAGLGIALARASVATFGLASVGRDLAFALQGGAEVGFHLGRGFLVFGARYLHADLGRLSSGDTLAGNSAGLLADAGYRMGF